MLLVQTTTVELVRFNNYTDLLMEVAEDTIVKCANLTARSIRWEPDDLAQEFRLLIWQKLQKYNPEIASVQNWTWIVCTNKVRDLSRRNKRLKIDCLEMPHSLLSEYEE